MRALVVAKAPVPGAVKTRLGARLGMDVAARLASAALLDTLAACDEAFDERHLALDGDLDAAHDGHVVRGRLDGWTVHPQRGATFGERLAHAHADARGPGVTVQIGMDTPQVTAAHLQAVVDAAVGGDAVLGPATDGGWWVLALSDHRAAATLAAVPLSRSDTCTLTRTALTGAGQTVRLAAELTDVDEVEDARLVANGLGDTHFARAWQEVAPWMAP
jgi:glycosyltransferase A (GT-A) superfamily protein (DUF2064 family)